MHYERYEIVIGLSRNSFFHEQSLSRLVDRGLIIRLLLEPESI